MSVLCNLNHMADFIFDLNFLPHDYMGFPFSCTLQERNTGFGVTVVAEDDCIAVYRDIDHRLAGKKPLARWYSGAWHNFYFDGVPEEFILRFTDRLHGGAALPY